jgi:hypothetical protein
MNSAAIVTCSCVRLICSVGSHHTSGAPSYQISHLDLSHNESWRRRCLCDTHQAVGLQWQAWAVWPVIRGFGGPQKR